MAKRPKSPKHLSPSLFDSAVSGNSRDTSFPEEKGKKSHGSKVGASVVRTDTEEIIKYILLPGEEIVFTQATFAQCFLPYRSIKETRWEVTHGNASLVINAGELVDPANPGAFVQQAIPSGAKARLLLTYINTQAIKTGRHIIDMGRSMRQFMEKNGIPVGGKNGKAITQEVRNVAAASIAVAKWEDDRVRHQKAQIVSMVDFWLEQDERQFTIWEPELELSADYLSVLKEHRVPINFSAMVALQSKPRAMDVYVWLSYRLPRISRRAPVKIRYGDLWPIFGSTITRLRDFKKHFQQAVIDACQYFPDARIEFEKDYIALYYAPSPVPVKERMYYKLK